MAKILIANKFYYPRGGDCIYTINLAQLLKDHGHDVAIFAMQHSENIPTIWEKYFPKEVKFEPGLNILDAIIRPFGTQEVIKKFNALLDDFKPDIVHLNNIHSQLSPVIAELSYNRNIKVVWTIHDNKLLCPQYSGFRNGTTCRLCSKDKFNVIKYKCMKNSLPASFIAYWEALKWNKDKLEKYTNLFLPPSLFMSNSLLSGGFHPSKIKQLYHFVNKDKYENVKYDKKDYYCYIGRISSDKGVSTLIDVANKLPYQLKIIGDGPSMEELKNKVKDNKHIEFLGFKNSTEIKDIVSKARFSVVPSEVNEVLGLVVIESLCIGTPVLGANIGGIPELIENGVNGMIFESKNKTELKDKIEMMWNAHFDYESIARKAQQKYNAERYYQELVNNIYKLSI